MKKLSLILLLLATCLQAQITGTVRDAVTNQPLVDVEIYTKEQLISKTDSEGKFNLNESFTNQTITFYNSEYQIFETNSSNQDFQEINVLLEPIILLTGVQIQGHKKREFALRRMKDVEGTSILAGKKNEVVLLDQMTANLATNNARQIYGQVVGLNIFDYNDGGLQLGIGGRGLDPNRTANFNTRQNGYDISADVLGYPESYYTPATEALDEIQIIRGAASLQYGTQFGGLINFKFREPNPNKKFEFITRNTVGSNQLFTTFNSINGTVGKLGYYAFVNYKKGNSFRPNSGFEALNYFAHLQYQLSAKTKIAAEFTHFNYLTQQPGGLTDVQFQEDPKFSNRQRNWFQVDWNLFDLSVEHDFSENSKFSTHIFGLQSSRDALGFRSNRVSQVDEPNEPRDLLRGDFNNWGFESRFLQHYHLFQKENDFLIGVKYYNANNQAEQGPGTLASDANFNYDYASTPNYPYQAKLDYPNRNLALFGENIFNITKKFSLTPGFRYEWINTQAQGNFKYLELDLAGNILYEQIVPVKEEKKRDFLLLGLGASYKNPNIEYYANMSQNYRSVTFNDIHTLNPNRFVADDITDETGYTFDLGLRGKYKKYISFDTNIFTLLYDNRIGDYIRNSDGKRGRDNIGTANIYGLELFADFDLDEIFDIQARNFAINYFINTAFTQSEYTKQLVESNATIIGNQVEYVPNVNLKTGVGFGYKNFTSQLQLSYLSKQYTDAGNTPASEDPINGGIIGPIPAYTIVDLSLAYTYRKFKLEGNLNNLLNNKYFVRRADGYPGPGIIPSEPMNWGLTLEIKL